MRTFLSDRGNEGGHGRRCTTLIVCRTDRFDRRGMGAVGRMLDEFDRRGRGSSPCPRALGENGIMVRPAE